MIFDAFNTLVRPVAGSEGTFAIALAGLGVDASPNVLAHLHAASAGLDHRRWSRSREDYASWTRGTLRRARADLLGECASAVIPALEQWHQAPMEQFPDVTACLSALRSADLIIAVCSNWGWDLADDLEGAAVAGMVDIIVSSASAGCRKPHPDIYSRLLELAEVLPGEAVFVGDNVETDVRGPQHVGMTSILLDRTGAGAPGHVSLASLADLAWHLRV